jgi:hydroxypyruvate reductase
MALGAHLYFQQSITTLIISKYNHIDALWAQKSQVKTFEAGHPIPDQQSLIAGACLLTTVKQQAKDSRLLLLVSGGASAVAECLVPPWSLLQLQQLTETMLASGQTIVQINQQRKQHSLLKDGKLLSHFNGCELNVMLISDVQGDDIEVIGSGLGSTHRLKAAVKPLLVASNEVARNAAKNVAINMGLVVRYNQESLYGDVFIVAATIAKQLKQGKPGVYIYGGEPTIVLPKTPGRGGRSQSLALALAIALKGFAHIEVLVAGTDGTDGPTQVAGAIIDGNTVKGCETEAKKALSGANAFDFFATFWALIKTGPTGTNVMDLVIGVVKPEKP